MLEFPLVEEGLFKENNILVYNGYVFISAGIYYDCDYHFKEEKVVAFKYAVNLEEPEYDINGEYGTLIVIGEEDYETEYNILHNKISLGCLGDTWKDQSVRYATKEEIEILCDHMFKNGYVYYTETHEAVPVEDIRGLKEGDTVFRKNNPGDEYIVHETANPLYFILEKEGYKFEMQINRLKLNYKLNCKKIKV